MVIPRDPSIQVIPIMENEVDKNMETETETGVLKGAI